MRAVLTQLLLNLDHGAAKAALASIVGRDPEYAEAVFNLGLLTEANRDHAGARNLYTRVLQLNPRDGLKSMARDGLQRVASGTDPYSRIVAQAAALHNAGLSSLGAARSLEAITIDPKRWEAYAIASLSFRSTGHHDRAVEMIRAAIRNSPPQVRSRLAQEQHSLVTEISCAPIVKAASAADSAAQYSRAGEILAQGWKNKCGGREDVGLAAARAYVRAGNRERAQPLLVELKLSRNPAVSAAARSIEGAP